VDPDSTTYVSRSPLKINDPKYGPPFEIKTYSGSGMGNVSLRKATLASDNSVYIQLALDLGPEKVKQAAWDMGIRSPLEAVPAETLGGLGNCCSPLEMANAYATIASGGMRNRPTAITKVTFPDGHSELPPRWKVRRTRAFEDGVTAKATEILEQNIQAGTGTKASIGCPAGGKTGTTDLNTDAWFVGITPRLATAVWVGYPKDRTQMSGLYYGANVDGGTFPAEIWGTYMKEAIGKFCGDFKPPKTPFQASPFFGEYASSGGGKGSSLEGGSTTGDDSTGFDATTPSVPEAPAEESPEETDDEAPDTGGDEGFDPEAYEAPPQGPPPTGNGNGNNGNGNGNGGGTQAPG